MKKIFSHFYKKYSFEFFLDENFPNLDLITFTFWVIFWEENKIWITKNHRGWELPGWHIEPGEDLETSLNRELKEELWVETWDYKLVWYKKITNFKKTKNRNWLFYPFPNSYIVFFIWKSLSEKKYSFCKDTIDSKLCSLEEALEIMDSENDKIILKSIIENQKTLTNL